MFEGFHNHRGFLVSLLPSLIAHEEERYSVGSCRFEVLPCALYPKGYNFVTPGKTGMWVGLVAFSSPHFI